MLRNTATLDVKRRKKKEGSACVYFGKERLEKAQDRARESYHGNLSGYLSNLIDAGLEVDPQQMVRLSALATLRGKTTAELLSDMIARELAGKR